ncbi:TPA: hypothetical protein NJY97_004632 [Vibrio parahaemolyticus]|nr:hypothetical protein [Vibrio parahaemolyticus]MDG2678618.1 hypothetical protein [Vibrio parahaemolyticus]HCE1609436.1 hypothetical protein [Vibrio parahaemolyticus]HCE5232400.1 hypothetical protein [Vibrio parahaemolyticus]HCG5110882.1 hypothetical protein [Vibrio parahaemolyticus]
MKSLQSVILLIFTMTFSLSVAALQLADVKKGCELAHESFSKSVPNEVVYSAIFEATNLTVDDFITYCVELAKTTYRGLDDKTIDMGGVNKASVNDIVALVGNESSSVSLFTRNDQRCSASSNQPGSMNCSAGCLSYHFYNTGKGVFLGFSAGFNMLIHSAQYKLMGNKNSLNYVKACSDIRRTDSSAMCVFNMCPLIHKNYVKYQR